MRIPPYPSKPHSTGQARITLGGKAVYLGKFGTPLSHERYDREVAEWLAGGGRRFLPPAHQPASVAAVLAAYWTWVTGPESPYRKRGALTNQVDRIKLAVRPVRELYGSTPAADFGPKRLKAVRDWMVRKGWSRNFTNSCVGCVKRVFRWAVTEELIPGAVFDALQCVEGLRRGQSGARETEPVGPVPWATVEATLPYLLPTVADMVRVQNLADLRPCEVCHLRPCDIAFDGRLPDGQVFPGVWVYVVPREVNKMAHKGRQRIVFFGDKAQAILRPYFDRRRPEEYLFSPREAMTLRRQEQGRAIRFGKLLRDHYCTRTYGLAVQKAAKRAGVPHWSPLQLRHARATELRARFGLDVAGAVLGHGSLAVTQIYAEQNLAKAAEAMRQVG